MENRPRTEYDPFAENLEGSGDRSTTNEAIGRLVNELIKGGVPPRAIEDRLKMLLEQVQAKQNTVKAELDKTKQDKDARRSAGEEKRAQILAETQEWQKKYGPANPHGAGKDLNMSDN